GAGRNAQAAARQPRRYVGRAQALAVDRLLARIGHACLQVFARADRAVAGRRVGQGAKALDAHAAVQGLLGGVERRLERRAPGERTAEEAELVRGVDDRELRERRGRDVVERERQRVDRARDRVEALEREPRARERGEIFAALHDQRGALDAVVVDEDL